MAGAKTGLAIAIVLGSFASSVAPLADAGVPLHVQAPLVSTVWSSCTVRTDVEFDRDSCTTPVAAGFLGDFAYGVGGAFSAVVSCPGGLCPLPDVGVLLTASQTILVNGEPTTTYYNVRCVGTWAGTFPNTVGPGHCVEFGTLPDPDYDHELACLAHGVGTATCYALATYAPPPPPPSSGYEQTKTYTGYGGTRCPRSSLDTGALGAACFSPPADALKSYFFFSGRFAANVSALDAGGATLLSKAYCGAGGAYTSFPTASTRLPTGTKTILVTVTEPDAALQRCGHTGALPSGSVTFRFF